MNPISLLLHIGAIIKAVKDLEISISDAVKGNWPAEKGDAINLISDIEDLLSLIQIPGVTPDQIKAILDQLKQSIGG